MKKRFAMFWFTILSALINYAQCEDFVYIPDANFKAALVENIEINTNGDAEISCEEASSFSGSIDVSERSINTLQGIESFINIRELYCSNNNLETLDISNNLSLYWLVCDNNNLEMLDLSNNNGLGNLRCSGNALTNLDVTNNWNLETLFCAENALTELNTSSNIRLQILQCPNNNITSLDLSYNFDLQGLSCSNNLLTSLDVSHNSSLFAVACSNNYLSTIDVSDNPIQILLCSGNNISSLDVSDRENLEYLECSNNSLTALNFSNNKALEFLDCSNNELEILNMSNGNYTILNTLNAVNNPALNCINVDNVEYTTENWNIIVDEGVTFSENCEATLSIIDNKFSESVSVYPNPVLDNLNISLNTSNEITEVKIYNLQGAEVLASVNTKINMQLLSAGMYVVKIFGKDGEVGVKTILKK